MNSVKNKAYTLITGASSGIGRASAKKFASYGSNLILTARRKKALLSLKKEILKIYPDLDIILISTDLSKAENARALYEKTKKYFIKTWINNAGFGNYSAVSSQNLDKIHDMLCLNIESLVILSTLYIRDYQDISGTQLINVSSCGGYTLVPNAVSYCASKYFVSSFTEGLAHELDDKNSKLKVKLFAPAAVKTNFGKRANDIDEYDYDLAFPKYHTSDQAADLLLRLYESDKTIGIVNRETFEFSLKDPLFDYAGYSKFNQKL